jgi:hypothetical protein
MEVKQMLQDLLNAIDTYPADNVTIQIINFEEPGGHINAGEVCTFDVRVTNNGQLDMRNLRLHVQGSQWTSVKRLPTDSFGSYFISGARDVDAHTAVTFGRFRMRADQGTPDGGTSNEELISAHISSYDAGLDHILGDHGHHASNPEAAYTRHIHPS